MLLNQITVDMVLLNGGFFCLPSYSYCDCFANGEFCNNCNCNNCFNNLEHETERLKAIKVRQKSTF